MPRRRMPQAVFLTRQGDYAEAERTVLIRPGNVVLRTAPTPPADGSTPQEPSGIILSPSDFDEIYALVKSGTSVTIK